MDVVTKGATRGLKQQKFIVSQVMEARKSDIKVLAGAMFPLKPVGNPSLSIPGFWGLPEMLVFLGLQLHSSISVFTSFSVPLGSVFTWTFYKDMSINVGSKAHLTPV